MNVRVVTATCEGYGVCAAHAPAVFTLDESGYASVETDGEVPADQEHLVQRAIVDCPVHAIEAVD